MILQVLPSHIFNRFLWNFQDPVRSPSSTTYHLVFYVADLRSAGGHAFVMLRLWEKIQTTSVSENNRGICLIPSLLCFNALVCNNMWPVFFLFGVLTQLWGQIRSTEVKWRFGYYRVTKWRYSFQNGSIVFLLNRQFKLYATWRIHITNYQFSTTILQSNACLYIGNAV